MADSWSGFIAYTYDGPNDFTMFNGGPWNGKTVLTPTEDFENFKSQLHKISRDKTDFSKFDEGGILSSRCSDVEAYLLFCCDVRLFSDNKMPSFATLVDPRTGRLDNKNMWVTTVAFFIVLCAAASMRRRSQTKNDLMPGISLLNQNSTNNDYQSISSSK